jgi:hypothetical protein
MNRGNGTPRTKEHWRGNRIGINDDINGEMEIRARIEPDGPRDARIPGIGDFEESLHLGGHLSIMHS